MYILSLISTTKIQFQVGKDHAMYILKTTLKRCAK